MNQTRCPLSRLDIISVAVNVITGWCGSMRRQFVTATMLKLLYVLWLYSFTIVKWRRNRRLMRQPNGPNPSGNIVHCTLKCVIISVTQRTLKMKLNFYLVDQVFFGFPKTFYIRRYQSVHRELKYQRGYLDHS